jgi:ankyrin repeat protein
MVLCLSSCLIVKVGNYPPLFVAAENGDIAQAEKLIKNCESVNQVTIGGQTPLHLAAESGKDEMVVWLLAREADPTAKDQHGQTPYDFAMEQRQVNSATIISNYLENRQAEKDVYQMGRLSLLDGLLYIEDVRRLDALHYFAEVADVKNLTAQIQKTENINVTSAAGKTPLHFAVIAGQINSTQILLDAGADPNIGDMYNKTPLYYAVENKNAAIVKLLVKFDADPSKKSYCKNMSPYDLAMSMNNQDILELLKAKK